MEDNDFAALGVAGPLTDHQKERIRQSNFDVDAYYSIGVSGPPTPELIIRIAELGSQEVAETIHGALTGPIDPDDLERLLTYDLDQIRTVSQDGPVDSVTQVMAKLKK